MSDTTTPIHFNQLPSVNEREEILKKVAKEELLSGKAEKHFVVFTLHDTNGRMTELLKQVAPKLEKLFDRAFVSITPITQEKGYGEDLKDDGFFEVNYNEASSGIGDHFANGIKAASKAAEDEDIIHICTLDRLSYELLNYEKEFEEEMEREKGEGKPILYVRSEKAWQTHPLNYWAIESMGTELCKKLTGKELDLFWCDLTMKNKFLKKIVPIIEQHDLRVWVELLWPVRNEVTVKVVDWLSWEDPFVFQKDAANYKKEREESSEENKKRFGYVVPIIEWVMEKVRS